MNMVDNLQVKVKDTFFVPSQGSLTEWEGSAQFTSLN
jgi:hypothetical protein